MTEKGVVYKLKGKRCVVRFDRRSACASCHMCNVAEDKQKVEVLLENSLDAKIGDIVEVEMGERYVLTAAVIVYVIPLILVGAGIGIGSLVSELCQILMAVGGFIFGFVIAALLDKFVIRKKKGFKPEMKVICSETSVTKEA